MKMLPIGFSNYVSPIHIISILSPESSPIKRLIADTKEKGMLIDASFGRSTRSVLVTDSGNVILSSQPADVLSSKLDEILNSEEDIKNG